MKYKKGLALLFSMFCIDRNDVVNCVSNGV